MSAIYNKEIFRDLIKNQDRVFVEIENEVNYFGGALINPDLESTLNKKELSKWLKRVFQRKPYKSLKNNGYLSESELFDYINNLPFKEYKIPVIYTKSYVLFIVVNSNYSEGQIYIVFKRDRKDASTSVESILKASSSAIKLPIRRNL